MPSYSLSFGIDGQLKSGEVAQTNKLRTFVDGLGDGLIGQLR